MFKLVFYVPEESLSAVKEAIFKAGGGQIGNYEACAWEVKGWGQFRPLLGSRPALGELGVLERVEEYRVELVCSDESIAAAVEALKLAHPYETPAYSVVRLEDF